MRYLLLCLLVVGCDDNDISPDSKSEAVCGESWEPRTTGKSCDLACAEVPTMSGEGCELNIVYIPMGASEPFKCDLGTFEFDGERGCCLENGLSDWMVKPGVEGEPVRTRRVLFASCK